MTSILAIIPARGGSKGIPKKNICLLNGKPLLLYTIEALQACRTTMFIVVSTDNAEITAIAKTKNICVINRPRKFATDRANTESVLLHVLNYLEKQENKGFEFILTVQPTSPFRKPETIDRFINRFLRKKNVYNAQLTLHEDYADFWVKNNYKYTRLYPDAPRRRQDRKPLYVENGCLYITNSKVLRETNSVLGSRCNGFIIDKSESLDINEMEDLEMANIIMRNKILN
ncbi:MAG: acylneuraminate cytidylyltransferase family protein [Bacteroidales bacterium]|jgi:CMP-N-acetylneuraminic acid synthetase|nr:acylneuraminate cytidylyltransferase family protein [Bacteroidales bacterium]